jgi:hypothetical protein
MSADLAESRHHPQFTVFSRRETAQSIAAITINWPRADGEDSEFLLAPADVAPRRRAGPTTLHLQANKKGWNAKGGGLIVQSLFIAKLGNALRMLLFPRFSPRSARSSPQSNIPSGIPTFSQPRGVSYGTGT